MNLVLLAEHYEDAEEARICDWCHEDIPQGASVWVVTLKENKLREDNIATLDICMECSVMGPLENFFAS